MNSSQTTATLSLRTLLTETCLADGSNNFRYESVSVNTVNARLWEAVSEIVLVAEFSSSVKPVWSKGLLLYCLRRNGKGNQVRCGCRVHVSVPKVITTVHWLWSSALVDRTGRPVAELSHLDSTFGVHVSKSMAVRLCAAAVRRGGTTFL